MEDSQRFADVRYLELIEAEEDRNIFQKELMIKSKTKALFDITFDKRAWYPTLDNQEFSNTG